MSYQDQIQAPFALDGTQPIWLRTLPKQTLRLLLCAALFGADLLALVSGPVIANLLVTGKGGIGGIGGQIWPMLSLLPMYFIIGLHNGAYSTDALSSRLESLHRAIASFAFAVFTVLAVVFFLKTASDVSRLGFGANAAVSFVMLCAVRVLFVRQARRLVGGVFFNELLIVDGTAGHADPGDARVLDAGYLRLSPNLQDPDALHRFGMLAHAYDRIVVSAVPERQAAWALMLKGANIDGEILMDQANAVGAIGVSAFGGAETMLVSRRPLSLPARGRKRALDLALTIPTLIGLLPLFALIALAIRLDSPGPVLFRQARVGRGNRQFQVLKFRSMRVEQADASGARSASRDDDRITRVGRIIRSTSLDELPQLLNVLIGDMSLVGPRPHALGSLAGESLFWEIDETYWHRHQLKPGITGLAQVRGFRGATDNREALIDRLQADMEYVQGWTLWRDCTIMLRTLRVLTHRNAF